MHLLLHAFGSLRKSQINYGTCINLTLRFLYCFFFSVSIWMMHCVRYCVINLCRFPFARVEAMDWKSDRSFTIPFQFHSYCETKLIASLEFSPPSKQNDCVLTILGIQNTLDRPLNIGTLFRIWNFALLFMRSKTLDIYIESNLLRLALVENK